MGPEFVLPNVAHGCPLLPHKPYKTSARSARCTVVGNDLLDGRWHFRNFWCISVSVTCKLTQLFETSIRMIWFFRNAPPFKARLRVFHDSIKYALLPQNLLSRQIRYCALSFMGSHIDHTSKCCLQRWLTTWNVLSVYTYLKQ